MRFEAFGPLTASADGEAMDLRPAERRLLCLLLLELDRGLSADVLIDRMWNGSAPRTARNTLQAHISSLRRRLPVTIVTTDQGYRLDLTGHELDTSEFERLAEEAQTLHDEGTFESAITRARAALDLSRGEPFADLLDVEASRTERHRVTELRLSTRGTLARSLMATGRPDDAVSVLRELVNDHPLHEPSWESLMQAYYQSGRQSESLRAYGEIAAHLREEMGIDPGTRLQELEERILLNDPSLAPVRRSSTPNNLPQRATKFVGRDIDVARVVDLIDRNPITSIVGGPGIGKTRLAVEVGAATLDRFPGGVWFVRLLEAVESTEVIANIARTTGVTDELDGLRQLAKLLTDQPTLLVLDNCEHVLDAIRELLAEPLPDPLRIVATSRRPLGISGERVWRLAPLEIPAEREGLESATAVQLLVDRVLAVDPAFTVGSDNASGIVELCRQSGGIPLALELMATWLPSISVSEVGQMSLAPSASGTVSPNPHHLSMAQAVEWSRRTLAPDDRTAFDAASVFTGSFDIDSFWRVCLPHAPRPTAVATITRLVDSSLLTPERSERGDIRYRMLEPLREHGWNRLREADRDHSISDRHADWALQRTTAVAAVAKGPEEARMFEQLDFELGDVRKAMRHLLEIGRSGDVARAASSLLRYWFARYLGREAQRWLREALTGEMDDETRMAALSATGWAAYLTASYDQAEATYEECLRLARRCENRLREGEAVYGLARIHLPRRYRNGEQLLRQALQIFECVGAESQSAECRLWLGLHSANKGDIATARSLLTPAVSALDRLGYGMLVSVGHRYLSLAAWYDEDEKGARAHLAAAESVARTTGDRRAIGGALIQRGLVEGTWGHPSRAAEAILDALRPLPESNDIDFCLVSFGALPTLIRTGRHVLAHQLLGYLDHTYDRYGWIPLDQRMPAVEEFRRQIAAGGGEVSPDHLLYDTESMSRALTAELHAIAGEAVAAGASVAG